MSNGRDSRPWVLLCVLFGLLLAVSGQLVEDAVEGPVVQVAAEAPSNLGGPEGNGSSDPSKSQSLAEALDKVLIKEFAEESKKKAEDIGKSFNKTVQTEEAHLETVVRISSNNNKEEEEHPQGNSTVVDSKHDSTADDSDGDQGERRPEKKERERERERERGVDRIIDSRDNEFVLSFSKDNYATLTLDPQLVQDLTVVFSSSAVMGCVFEFLKQPVINGYLVAGAVVGPGGLGLVKELVQVESLAQLGVQLLLFGLGLDLSVKKLKSVWGVALVGGFLQILAMIVISVLAAAAMRASLRQAVFIGALLSMSSTAVVIKILDLTKTSNSAYGAITIGTLILQDCSVGLMFALMPAFSVQRSHITPEDGQLSSAYSLVLQLVGEVMVKLALTLVLALLIATTALPVLLRLLIRSASQELIQLALVGFCLSSAWISGEMGLSEELGAFVAGFMISMAENKASAPMSHISLPDLRSEHEQSVGHTITSIQNVLTALFVTSIGLVMSPSFLLEHLGLLMTGTLVVMVLKTLVVAGIVHLFGITPRISLAVGISMAHIGEFSFVLLSLANQLKLLSPQVYMLLLGVTAVSLLSAPMVILVCHRLLRVDTFRPYDRVASDEEASVPQRNTPEGVPCGATRCGGAAKLHP